MTRVLRNPAFVRLWIGGTISSVGDMVLLIALPFHVYNLTGSTLATGTTFLAEMIPRLLLGFVGGVFADRWDRKRTMILMDIARAMVLLPLVLVGSEDRLWVVYVVAVAKSTLSQFFGPARSALLPRLVSREDLVAANSVSSASESLVRLIGPTLGGVLLAFSGLTFVVLLDALSYLASAVMIAWIHLAPEQRRASPDLLASERSGTRTPFAQQWREGLRMLRANQVILRLVLVSGVVMVAQGMINVLLVPYVKEMLGGGSIQFGWLATAQGIGGLAGGLLMGHLGQRWLTPRLMALSVGTAGLLFLLMIHFPSLGTALVLIALVGAPSSIYSIGLVTLLQTHSEDLYRGRIFGIYGALIMLATGAGMGLATVLGDLLPLPALLDIAGGLFIGASLLGLRIFGTDVEEGVGPGQHALEPDLGTGTAAPRQETAG